jgi:hypothetical protein
VGTHALCNTLRETCSCEGYSRCSCELQTTRSSLSRANMGLYSRNSGCRALLKNDRKRRKIADACERSCIGTERRSEKLVPFVLADLGNTHLHMSHGLRGVISAGKVIYDWNISGCFHPIPTLIGDQQHWSGSRTTSSVLLSVDGSKRACNVRQTLCRSPIAQFRIVRPARIYPHCRARKKLEANAHARQVVRRLDRVNM